MTLVYNYYKLLIELRFYINFLKLLNTKKNIYLVYKPYKGKLMEFTEENIIISMEKKKVMSS